MKLKYLQVAIKQAMKEINKHKWLTYITYPTNNLFHGIIALMENEKAKAVLGLDFSNCSSTCSPIYHKKDNQPRYS